MEIHSLTVVILNLIKKRIYNKIDSWLNNDDDEDYNGERKFANESDQSAMNKLRELQKTQKMIKTIGEKAGNGEIGTKLLNDIKIHIKDELDFDELNPSQQAIFLSAFIGAVENRIK